MNPYTITNEYLIKVIENHLKEELSVKYLAEYFGYCGLYKLSDSGLLIKAPERLHNMRTIEFIDESKRCVKAKETVDIFMPIARRLGNNKMISELNDLGVKYIQ